MVKLTLIAFSCFLWLFLLAGCRSQPIQTMPTTSIMPSRTPIKIVTQTASSQPHTPTVTATPSLTLIPTSEPRPHLQLVFKYAFDKRGAVYALPFDLNCLTSAAPCIGKPELLFEFGARISALQWSPDGAKAVIAALDENSGRDDIFLIDAKGQLIKRITQTSTVEGDPTWLPDANHISYVGCVDGKCNYVKVDLDGNDASLLLNMDNLNVEALSWSPDGKKIVFAGTILEFYSKIFIVNPDGSDLTRLSAQETYRHFLPQFSPDGKWIAYGQDNDQGGELSDIFLIHPDGSGEINLTKGVMPTQGKFAWSPIGDWISYNGCFYLGGCELFIIKPDGTENINLSQGADWELLGWRLFWAP